MKGWRFLGLILVLAAMGTPAVAADLAIKHHGTLSAGSQPERLTIEGATVQDLVTGGAKVLWYPRGSLQVWDGATWNGEPYLLAFADKAGTYLVGIAFVREGKQQYAEIELTVQGEDDDGDDNVNPPTPSPGKRWVILVEETKQRTPALARMIADPSFREYCKAQGHLVRILDPNKVVPAGYARYVQAAPKVPYLFIVDEKGVGFKGDPPADAKALTALLKKWGG